MVVKVAGRTVTATNRAFTGSLAGMAVDIGLVSLGGKSL
jgi:hypothetical protein